MKHPAPNLSKKLPDSPTIIRGIIKYHLVHNGIAKLYQPILKK